jgi:cell division protein FtsL
MAAVKFIKDYWFGLFILMLLIYMQLNNQVEILLYQKTIQKLNIKIEQHKEQYELYQKKIDSLSSLEQDVVIRIEKIKEKEYVQVKVVDSLPVSDLQQFFTERYQS